uniref:Ground-like domain-containing protein n=1 Tax=Rhabditophanes sp. KR3021 TaxID=114890 RepID=A0AC35U3I9_9BILA
MKYLAIVAVVLSLTLSLDAFMTGGLGGGGGGGGGCGCGCGPQLPQLSLTCISIPAIRIPIPSMPSCPQPCGGRKKRSAAKKPLDDRCTDSALRKLILTNINESSSKSQENIYEAAKSYFNETDDYIVSCGPSENFYFTTSLDNYCVDGTDKLTCSIFKYQFQ